MKKIKEKYSKKLIDYSIIKPLEFKIIRYIDDGFYNIVDNSVRRNLNWKNEVILEQSTVLDFGELLMLSRIHFNKCKIMNIKLEVSEKEEGPFINLFKEMIIITGGIKVLKIGNIPCRYIKLTVLKGSPIQDFKRLECYGLTQTQMKEIYNDEMLKLLLYNTYNLIYTN